MKKIITTLLLIALTVCSIAQIPDPCTGAGAAQPISTTSPCNCSEVNVVSGTPCNKSSFIDKAASDAAIAFFITNQSSYALPTTPAPWQDVRGNALNLAGTFKHEFCTEITTDPGTNKLFILNIAQVQINCNAVCQDYKIIQKTGTCGINAITPTLVPSALNPTVNYRQYNVLPNTTYIICRQLYYDGSDLDCYGSWVGGDGVNSLGAQVTAQHWFYYQEGIVTPLGNNTFKGIQVAGTNILEWTTDNQNEIAKFDIEKSTTGAAFTTIATVLKHTVSKYNYTDAASNQLAYYRLKVTSNNNTQLYSYIIKLSNSPSHNAFTIYPNPAAHSTTLSIYKAHATAATIQVYNFNGTLVHTQYNQLSAGINTVPVLVNQLPQGIYSIKLVCNHVTVTQKLIIQ